MAPEYTIIRMAMFLKEFLLEIRNKELESIRQKAVK